MIQSSRLAAKLTNKAEQIVRRGHPWVFSDSIVKLSPDGDAGDLVILFSQRRNEVFAIGLYDPDSAVQIKIIHLGGSARIDSEFFKDKVEQAYHLREPLLQTDTDAYRLLFGENDGFPGLICDVYAKVGVIKVYSVIWMPYMEMIIDHIMEVAGLETIVLRQSRNLQKLELPYTEGDVVRGELKNPEVLFREYGIQFVANVLDGHKTGFFLDHRSNRREIGLLAKDKTVLDVFAYAGGFSVHALVGGALEVTSLDISEQALELAQQNAELNPHPGNYIRLVGEAFQTLRKLVQQGKKYDIVVIDPPSFAKSEKEKETALKKYTELTELGTSLTIKEGILVLASCSSRISEEEFRDAHREAFRNLRTRYTVEKVSGHDVDHPVTFEEGAYLNTVYYRII